MSIKRVDWEAIEIAVERNSPDTESYLQRDSGQVVTITQNQPEASQLLAKVKLDIENFVRIEPASSREQYRWMERFVASVSDEPLQQRLFISIDGKGAFRRFKDVLQAYPAVRERWFNYRSDLLHYHIQSWLLSHSVALDEDPPWGEVEEVLDLPSNADISNAQSPVALGENLRRQAREIIEGIAPLDLPSAIAFLSFLQEKGSEPLLSLKEESEPANLVISTVVR